MGGVQQNLLQLSLGVLGVVLGESLLTAGSPTWSPRGPAGLHVQVLVVLGRSPRQSPGFDRLALLLAGPLDLWQPLSQAGNNGPVVRKGGIPPRGSTRSWKPLSRGSGTVVVHNDAADHVGHGAMGE